MKRRDFVSAVVLAGVPLGIRAQRPVEILGTIALQGALEQIEPLLASAAGPVAFEFSTTAALAESIASGAAADVAILTRESLLDLAKRGHVREPFDLVRSRIGIAVRDDAVAPRMRTTEDFVAFLRATPSIAYTERGVSGLHMARVIPELGLVDVVAPKALVVDGFAGTPLREGRVAAAVQQISELRFAGATNIVPLPDALQVETIFSAAVATASSETARVAEVVRLLRSSAAAAAYESYGLVPAFR
jgi:molybdate transport system substrate-binding protein